MMSWEDLRYVLAVARHGTLSEGAKSLRVNATTVSRRIKALEEATGAPLFEKLKHGAKLTAAGEEMVAVAREVAAGNTRFGIMVDGAGIGSCMAANKVAGVRAALCYDLSTANNAREHNDANLLTLGGGLVGAALAREIVKTFLSVSCTEERHLRRVQKVDALDGAGAEKP